MFLQNKRRAFCELYGFESSKFGTCSTTDVASAVYAVLNNESLFISFVYVAPITRIMGTTISAKRATSQQHAKAMMMPTKKVAKLAIE